MTDISFNIKKELEKYGLSEDIYEDSLNYIHTQQNTQKSVDWKKVKIKYDLPIHFDTLRKASQTIYGGAFVAEYYRQKSNKTAFEDIETAKSKYGVEQSINKDGSYSRNALVEITEEQSKDIDFMLKVHGFEPCEWELINIKNKVWNTYSKLDKISTLYSSAITARPKKVEWSIEDMDKYFETRQFKNFKELTKPTNYESNGEILEIDLPDLHAGLLSWDKETGENYDINITKENFLKCFNDILERSKNRKFEKIILATLGDLLHVDNDNQSTTRGTPQQVDGRVSKIFDITMDMLIDAIEILGNFAPVEVIYVSGNHDRLLGYTLLKGIEKAFRNDDNIKFDVSPNPRKFRKYDNVLIGWLHGDVNKNNISEWLQVEARKEYGDTKFAEVHCGHLHHQQTLEKSGMIIRYLPTICASSAWEHSMGFNKSVKTVVSFVWNKKSGLREMWYSNI